MENIIEMVYNGIGYIGQSIFIIHTFIVKIKCLLVTYDITEITNVMMVSIFMKIKKNCLRFYYICK